MEVGGQRGKEPSEMMPGFEDGCLGKVLCQRGKSGVRVRRVWAEGEKAGVV